MSRSNALFPVAVHVLYPNHFSTSFKRKFGNDHCRIGRIHPKLTFRDTHIQRNIRLRISLQVEYQNLLRIPRHNINAVMRFVQLFGIRQLIFIRSLPKRAYGTNKLPVSSE